MVSPCLLLLAVVLPCVMGTQVVISQVIPTEGDEYLMNCGGNGDLQYFLLHQKGSALVPGFYDTLKIQVFENASVFFESISLEHQGTHLCIRNSEITGGSKTARGFPTSVRVRALPPDDLWGEVYKAKFVTGFLAALVIAALFALGCLVYKYRWVPKDTDTSPMIVNSGYVNPAMTNDDTVSGHSTNM